MRIGFDAKRAFYNRSGLGNYSRHSISILSKFAPENDYFLYTPQTRKAIAFDIRENVSVKSPAGINAILSRSWRTHRIISDLQKDKIDLFHGLSNELPFTIRKTKIPSVVTIHDLIFLRYPEFYYSHDRGIYKTKFQQACNKANRIIAISEQTKSDIVEFFRISEDKIQVVYQGCDPAFSKQVETKKLEEVKKKYALPDDFILNVGTIERRKNIFPVIKALNEKNIDIPLVIVGKITKYAKSIQKYIQQNNMLKQVIILNQVSFTDLPAIYKLASVFIYPSLFEGFGIPIIEALSTGVPVITNKNGVFRESGGPESIYIDPENIDEISDAIVKLVNDQKWKENMIQEGLKYVEKFSEENIAKNLFEVYKSVL